MDPPRARHQLVAGEIIAKVVLVFRRSAPGVGTFDVALEIDDTLTSPQLDGFELPLVELFRE